ncbi:hypothetical protein SAMN03097694_1539 [Janthinobacterium lividum]|uniref:Uncharacterized protein n=1 Tax=Janthinobacterium lividum TaxID=29581 RepID=A0AB38C541_9BURK|nr:hypothetical protein SAMN03097694_1539 [Janthinobacterium lividum]
MHFKISRSIEGSFHICMKFYLNRTDNFTIAVCDVIVINIYICHKSFFAGGMVYKFLSIFQSCFFFDRHTLSL